MENVTAVLGRVFCICSFTSIVLMIAVSRKCFQNFYGEYLLQVLFSTFVPTTIFCINFIWIYNHKLCFLWTYFNPLAYNL